jgi:hypothetical protein
MKMRAYLVVSTVIFAFVAIMHLIRFVLNWTVQVGTWTVPHYASLLAVIVSAAFAVWGATLLRRT